MLLLILQFFVSIYLCIMNLNTSNVTVNRWVLNIPILGDIYLNTSNVTVNLYFKFIYKGVFTNLNTSNVTVNLLGWGSKWFSIYI